MRWVLNFLNFFTFFLVFAIVVNVPFLLIAFLLRKRVDRRLIRAMLAVGFAFATAYLLWRMEWFDVWRHGIPPLGYIITAYTPYTAALGLIGWFFGGLIARPSPRPLPTAD